MTTPRDGLQKGVPMMDLDSEQMKVVYYPDSSVCIAGPGSGKTRVLTAKAEKLSSEGADLICLTFTRSAAQEIRDRIPGIPAGTIHSFCHSVMGWNQDTEYEGLLTDFLQKGKDKFDWVLVDEVQDLTDVQLQVVLSLVGDKLFAVGDPYQSIYGYGGALGMTAIRLLQDQGCIPFDLKNNYRSVPEVVRKLNRIYERGLVSRGSKINGLTAVLTRSNEGVRGISEILKGKGIGHLVRSGSRDLSVRKEEDYGSRNIQVSTIHMAKGLEFDNVILFDWYPGKQVGEERNVYYVAASRASLKFIEVGWEKELLSELEKLFEILPPIALKRVRIVKRRVG